jgi:hypothetical protein
MEFFVIVNSLGSDECALFKQENPVASSSTCPSRFAFDPAAGFAGLPQHYSHLAETCGACHDTEARDWALSVHGKAMAAGGRDAPTCTDCHSTSNSEH